jgi:hypothetical protein
LFSVNSCDLLLSSQYIFFNCSPSYFCLVDICFLQFSLRSRYSSKYLHLLLDSLAIQSYWWIHLSTGNECHLYWFCSVNFDFFSYPWIWWKLFCSGKDASKWLLRVINTVVSAWVLEPRATGRFAMYNRYNIGQIHYLEALQS